VGWSDIASVGANTGMIAETPPPDEVRRRAIA